MTISSSPLSRRLNMAGIAVAIGLASMPACAAAFMYESLRLRSVAAPVDSLLIDVEQEGAGPGAPVEEPAPAPASEAIQRLDADTVAQLAVKQGPAVKVANTDITEKSLALQADRAYWRPTLSLQNQIQYQNGEPTSFFAVHNQNEFGVPDIRTEGGYLLGVVNMSMPLYSKGAFWGQDTWSAVQDDGKHRSALSFAELQAATASYQAVSAYFMALSAREQLAIQRHALQKRQEGLKIVEKLILSRQAPSADRLLLESQIAAARAGINTAESLFSASLMQLRSLVGLPLTQELELAELSASPPVPSDLGELIRQSASRHPLVKSQEAAILVAKGEAKQARADALPTVTISAQYAAANGMKGDDVPTLGAAGINVTVPISDFGQTRKKIRSKQASVQENEQRLEYETSTVTQGIIAAYQSLVTANELLPVLQSKVEQYRHIEEEDRIGYKLGDVPMRKVLDDESNTLAAQLQLVTGKYSNWLAYATLIAATGKPFSTAGLAPSE